MSDADAASDAPAGHAMEAGSRPEDGVKGMETDQRPQTNGSTYIKEENGTNGHVDSPVQSQAAGEGTPSSEANPKKRKRIDFLGPRAVSPPWKLPSIDGPTTFTQEGKRRSARTNEVPVDLKPGADKRRHTRAEHNRVHEKQGARKQYGQKHKDAKSAGAGRSTRGSAGDAVVKPQSLRSTRHSDSGSRVSASRQAQSNTQITYGRRHRISDAASSPEAVHRRAPTTRQKEQVSTPVRNGVHSQNADATAVSPPMSGFKVRLRGLHEANREPPRTLNPMHIPDPKKAVHGSFAAFIEQDDVWAGEDEGPITDKDALRTARSINRLLKESEPGGLLSEERSMILSQPSKAEEPPDIYGHWQHVVTQALNFRQLLLREVRHHKEAARKISNIACQALENDRRFSKLKPKISREEWEAKQLMHQRKRYQQVVRDMKGCWDLARKEVLKVFEAENEADRQKEGRKALDNMLDQSTALLKQRRGRMSSEFPSEFDDDDEYGGSMTTPTTPYSRDVSTSRGPSRMSVVSTPASAGEDEDGSGGGDEESDPENMTTDEEEGEDEEGDGDPDANLTVDELKARYGNLPEQQSDSEGENEEVDEADEVAVSDAEDEPEDEIPTVEDDAPDAAALAMLDEVDPMLLDDDEEDSGSETEPESSEEETEATDEEASQEEDEGLGGLYGFFGKKTAAALKEIRQQAEDEADAADPEVEDVGLDDVEEVIHDTDVKTKDEPERSPQPELSADDGTAQLPGDEQQPTAEALTQEEVSKQAIEQAINADVGAGGAPTPADTSAGDVDTPTDLAAVEVPTPAATSDEEQQRSKKSMVNGIAASPSVSSGVAAVVRRQSPDPTESRPLTPKSGQTDQIDVSLLLRGTLREYQQAGLDWLAGLYSAGSNGILADEMGLGKTIQTISLFAHLAIHQRIWGPHLIVVPTSVMLNWEMEFKKFLPGFKVLTYYGTIAERKKLRSGWLEPDRWNVVITSYNLVVQDKQAFKKRPWHYLVLDEAHQIKNWQTQKWQSMLNMNTQARLLLTGTPLQNNLSELWSLFFFLMPSLGDGSQGFAELEQFQSAMKRPADQILNQGRQQLDEEAKTQVRKLHEVLRPYLLRRLKADVEKQMPGKYEHVVYCKLSKRQRQLYDAFLGRAETRATLLGGSYVGVMHVLMELRKVCNHPDLFEERMVRTSFAMHKSAVSSFEPVDILIRKRLLAKEDSEVSLEYLGLNLVHKERVAKQTVWRAEYLKGDRPMADLEERATRRFARAGPFSGSTIASAHAFVVQHAKAEALDQLSTCRHMNMVRTSAAQRPVYGLNMRNLLTVDHSERPFSKTPITRVFDKKEHALIFSSFPMNEVNFEIKDLHTTLDDRSAEMHTSIGKFSIATPNVVAQDILELTLGQPAMTAAEAARTSYLKERAVPIKPPPPFSSRSSAWRQITGGPPGPDAYHEARVRQTIAFPDKRLLQYDCGKLQKLADLLRNLQAGGHRALIFTQMARVLDILEIFLNFNGYRYLRLDGTTKVEHRQLLTEKYNSDPSIMVFILSSRSGGLGINLTGADSVIFYDLDWNPAMDKQCQDRAHRIGQTRDVHIYKFVSEYTIEANILRKSNQKRLLDDVIIQKGEFTTDYFNRVTYKDAFGDAGLLEDNEASKAMDMVLGDDRQLGGVLQSVEDKEDATAAATAAKEAHDVEVEDEKEMQDEEPVEKSAQTAFGPTGDLERDEEDMKHVDDFIFTSTYRALSPFRKQMSEAKARDKAAARRAKDRGRVR